MCNASEVAQVANVEEKTKDQLRKEFPLVFQPEKRQAMAVEERRPGMFAECKQFPSGLASCMWGCFHVRTPGARGTGFKGHMRESRPLWTPCKPQEFPH